MKMPEQNREYRCHHCDSTRWEHYQQRDDDIIVATSYKAGTTWTQAILANLLFPDGEFPTPPADMSPWLDMNVIPLEPMLEGLEQQEHRRYIKTHLPLDGMYYDPKLKYMYVSRDGRDVFMSMWNHYSNYTDETLAMFNSMPGYENNPFPAAPEDIHEFWAGWISGSYFEWEGTGWPYWSHLDNVQTWWDYRHLPNIEFFHYKDMLADLEGEMRRMADYLDITVPEQYWPRIVDACTFEGMKKKAEDYVPGGGSFWKGGTDTFLNKGTNGRWRGVLTDEELAQYDAACEKALTPDCRAWLERGRSAS